MKALLAALLFAVAGTTVAAEPAEKPTQQNRMKQCNQDAAGKKGDERKQFMSGCLKGEASGAPAAQGKDDPVHDACGMMAAEKKLAGAAKSSFMKKCVADGGGAPGANPAHEACAKQATEKKLAGAAKSSFMKKCEADAAK